MNEWQLELYFKLEAIKTKKNSNQDKQYLEEFKEGNFTNLLKQISFTQEDIFDILISSNDVSFKLKKNLFLHLIKKINHIEKDPVDWYKEFVRNHNNLVRERLRSSYEKANKAMLKELWLLKYYKYNEKYFTLFGGKSLKMNDDDKKEWLDKKQKIINYFNKLYFESLLSLWNEKDFLSFRWIFVDNFWKENYIDLLNSCGYFSDIQKSKLLSWIKK